MKLTVYAQAQDFLDRTQSTLMQHEVANSLMLGLAMRLVAHPELQLLPPYLATVEDERGLVIAALRTPPQNVVLYSHQATCDAELLELLAQDLRGRRPALTGVFAPVGLADGFVAVWKRLTAQDYVLHARLRLFELTQVIPPVPAPGRLRVATHDDYALIMQWMLAFAREALDEDEPAMDPERVQHGLHRGDLHVWETPDGEVVTMASRSRPASTVITISYVYTPPEQRGKGYASNCVAALSQHLLDSGWRYCSLFTDLANPISNSIYQKVGYHPVRDFCEYAFR